MIARILGVVSGIWLMFSPAVFAYGDPAATSDRIFGPIGASIAFVSLWEILRPLRWGTLPVGLWLLVAPLVLGYGDAGAVASSIAVGAVMAVTAFLGRDTKQRFGGGWTTLLPGRSIPEQSSPPGRSAGR